MIVYYEAPLLPYSAFFKFNDDDKKILEEINLENRSRYNESTNYLSTVSKTTFDKYSHNRNIGFGVDISVVVISVKRSKEQNSYLVQTVAYLLQSIENFSTTYGPLRNANVTITLCNVNKEPTKHKELLKLSENFHVISRIKDKSFGHLNVFQKEISDYYFCLKETKKAYNAKYIFVLQDDALVHSDIFYVINEKLQFLNKKWPFHHANVDLPHDESLDLNSTKSLNENVFFTFIHFFSSFFSRKPSNKVQKTDWLFIKLFYPTKWGGYGFEFGIIIELIFTSVFCSSIATFLTVNFYKIYTIVFFKKKFLMNLYFVYSSFFFLCVSFTLMFLMLGRTTIMQWRTLLPALRHLRKPPICCYPANLYKTSNLDFLFDYLSSSSAVGSKYDNPIDILIDEYMLDSQYVSYLVEPNTVTHIGFHSSLGHTKTAVEFY